MCEITLVLAEDDLGKIGTLKPSNQTECEFLESGIGLEKALRDEQWVKSLEQTLIEESV